MPENPSDRGRKGASKALLKGTLVDDSVTDAESRDSAIEAQEKDSKGDPELPLERLRGSVERYTEPFEPISDWNAWFDEYGLNDDSALHRDQQAHEGPLYRLVKANYERIAALAEKHGCTNVRLFGSAARRDEAMDSDIDLLVDPGPDVTLFDLGGLHADLEELLERKIDLLTPGDIPHRKREAILSEAVRIDKL